MHMKRVFSRPVIFLPLVCFLLYSNTLTGEFLFDDEPLIVENHTIRSFSNASSIFSEKFFPSELTDSDVGYYRPLSILSFALDYRLWGLSSSGYHLTNIILHSANAVMLYLILFLLLDSVPLALLTALLYSAHPVHSVTVAYISNRTELLAAFFIFLSFLTFLRCLGSEKPFRKVSFYFFSLFTFACALLSKETPVIYPGVLLFYVIIFRRRRNNTLPRFLLACVPFFILSFSFILLHHRVAGLPSGSFIMNDLPAKLFSVNENILSYLFVLLLPYRVHFERFTLAPSGISAHLIVLALASVILCLVVLLKYRKSKAFLFFFCWFILFILPVSQIIPLYVRGFLFTPLHFLYLPSAGAIACAAVIARDCLGRLGRGGVKAVYALAVIFFIWASVVTIRSNNAFRDPVSFYTYNLSLTPQSTRLRNNLGVTLQKQGREEEAEKVYLENLEMDPGHWGSRYNLGMIYLGRDDPRRAARHLRQVVLQKDNHASAHNNLAVAYYRTGKADLALLHQKRAVSLDPGNPEHLFNLGYMLFGSGSPAAALEAVEKALALQSDEGTWHLTAADIHRSLMNHERAIHHYERALALDDSLGKAYLGLIRSFLAEGREGRAGRTLSRFSSQLPDSPFLPEAEVLIGAHDDL